MSVIFSTRRPRATSLCSVSLELSALQWLSLSPSAPAVVPADASVETHTQLSHVTLPRPEHQIKHQFSFVVCIFILNFDQHRLTQFWITRSIRNTSRGLKSIISDVARGLQTLYTLVRVTLHLQFTRTLSKVCKSCALTQPSHVEKKHWNKNKSV